MEVKTLLILSGQVRTGSTLQYQNFFDCDTICTTWSGDEHDFINRYYDEPLHIDPKLRQVYGHAIALEEFGSDYDMIIRARYDLVFRNDYFNKTFFDELVQKCYDEQVPAGIGTIWDRNGAEEKPYKTENYEVNGISTLDYMPDWIIVHPKDMFDIERAKNINVTEYPTPEVAWAACVNKAQPYFFINEPNLKNSRNEEDFV